LQTGHPGGETTTLRCGQMDVAAWCRENRVWVVAGKGGVGKTTIAAALARVAADAGLSVLLIELEGRQGLPGAFGRPEPLGYDPMQLLVGGAPDGPDGRSGREPADGTPTPGSGRAGPFAAGTVWARRLTPDDALLEYLADHGLQRVSKRLVSSGVLDVVATAIPGIRDVLVLGKIKQIERSGIADLVVVDAPATGHAMTFLTSASGLLDAARSGPVRSQAQEVVELLQDPARCRILLVTLPEEMPVSETVEAAFELEDRVGVRLGPVVVNCAEAVPPGLVTSVDVAARTANVTLDAGQHDALEAARQFRLRRLALARQQTERLRRELPLPQLLVPRLLSDSIGPVELERLASALAREVGALGSHAGAA
jgi:anion-transporting  ArsA/GET3 family ATPase